MGKQKHPGGSTSGEAAEFRADLEHSAETGGFFACVNQLLLTGSKPVAAAS